MRVLDRFRYLAQQCLEYNQTSSEGSLDDHEYLKAYIESIKRRRNAMFSSALLLHEWKISRTLSALPTTV